ncbi:hypothetical protein V2J09_000779 [Rumex salicifolius]
MGGICSRSATVEHAPSSNFSNINCQNHNGSGQFVDNHTVPPKSDSSLTLSIVNKQLRDPFSFPEISNEDSIGNGGIGRSFGINLDDINEGIPSLSRTLSLNARSARSKQAAVAKVSEMSSLLGKAGTTGLGKAVDVLDTVASSMTSLHLSGSFVSGVTTKGNKISILAFEVANTIVKGVNLMQSLSEENIKYLKDVVLHSEGVRNLISKDADELLRIAAADKGEELKVFSGEVVRFGNRCKDPQWHNLDRYFEKIATESTPQKQFKIVTELTPQKQLKDDAETIMQQLMTLVQYTSELYHELHALDRFEQDYRRKLLEEENPSTTQRGEGLAILRPELKSQRKHVRSLKKKSLWSRILEEVMEKLVDVRFLKPLVVLVSRPNSVPPNMRDALYHGLPPNIKAAIRSKLQSFQPNVELTVPQIKGEMEKTLQWLVPIAANTTNMNPRKYSFLYFCSAVVSLLIPFPVSCLAEYRAHHGFGWVGEWANSDGTRAAAGQAALQRIETLHHADKAKTEKYVLDLVVWLHHLIKQSRAAAAVSSSPVKSPLHSPNPNRSSSSSSSGIELSPQKSATCPSPTLTVEDQEMLKDVTKRKRTPGISKSQEFGTVKTRLNKHNRLSKSSNHSPSRDHKREVYSTRRPSSVPIINFDIDRNKAMDVIDRVDTHRNLSM